VIFALAPFTTASWDAVAENVRFRFIVAFRILKGVLYLPPPAQSTRTSGIEKFSTLAAPVGTKNVTG
jgi:hypothetical protein